VFAVASEALSSAPGMEDSLCPSSATVRAVLFGRLNSYTRVR
jgi:hypothetical protein